MQGRCCTTKPHPNQGEHFWVFLLVGGVHGSKGLCLPLPTPSIMSGWSFLLNIRSSHVPFSNFFFFFFVVLGFEFRALHLLGRCCTIWATLPALFCVRCLRDWVSWSICLDWLQTMFLLISASWIVRITGMSHWCLAWFEFISQWKLVSYLTPPPQKKESKLHFYFQALFLISSFFCN
jgi:hypothetical protein